MCDRRVRSIESRSKRTSTATRAEIRGQVQTVFPELYWLFLVFFRFSFSVMTKLSFSFFYATKYFAFTR